MVARSGWKPGIPFLMSNVSNFNLPITILMTSWNYVLFTNDVKRMQVGSIDRKTRRWFVKYTTVGSIVDKSCIKFFSVYSVRIVKKVIIVSAKLLSILTHVRTGEIFFNSDWCAVHTYYIRLHMLGIVPSSPFRLKRRPPFCILLF